MKRIHSTSINSYTYDVDLYLGKQDAISTFGLGYTIIMKLGESLFNQGYRFFMDNLYTSVILCIDLLKKGITACGTMLLNRKGMPAHFKYIKTLERASGSSRYFRDGHLLYSGEIIKLNYFCQQCTLRVRKFFLL